MGNNEYTINVNVSGVGSGGLSDPNEEPEEDKTWWQKVKEWPAKHSSQLKGVAAAAYSMGMSFASKKAGYSGNYIQQTRIREGMAAVGIASAVGGSLMAMASGNVFMGIVGLAATGIGIGMSIWEYNETIKQENLQAAYRATYSGVRMNQGRL